MITRFRKSMEKRDEGFTLVELLVVVIIIGILAAVAIPLYLNQQKRAFDSTAQTDLANLRVSVASLISENPSATTVTAAQTGGAGTAVTLTAGSATETFQASDGVVIAITGATLDALCLQSFVARGDIKAFSSDPIGAITTGPADGSAAGVVACS